MARRIAAGEALFGAVLGLLVGARLFLAAGSFAGSVRIWGLSAFPADVRRPRRSPCSSCSPCRRRGRRHPVALRWVTIEPLGVVRRGRRRRRRLWWRLLIPPVGVALLLPGRVVTGGRVGRPVRVAAGAALVLIGVTGLLPWLVEAVVDRLRGGPVAWQLAIRRLQLNSGTPARVVSGVAVAVAGAIALQMLFAGVKGDFVERPGRNPRAQMVTSLPRWTPHDREDARRLPCHPGVEASSRRPRQRAAEATGRRATDFTPTPSSPSATA